MIQCKFRRKTTGCVECFFVQFISRKKCCWLNVAPQWCTTSKVSSSSLIIRRRQTPLYKQLQWQQQGTNFQGVNCPSQDCISIRMCRLFMAQGRRTKAFVFFTLITTFRVICLISWPWCTPRRGSSARSRCTWWGGWGWPASSPSAVGTWPGRCGGTAPGSHGTGWPAPGQCCPGTPPRWSWQAHPLLQHNTGHTLLDICKILCFYQCRKWWFLCRLL